MVADTTSCRSFCNQWRAGPACAVSDPLFGYFMRNACGVHIHRHLSYPQLCV